jgi:hypothetical protein
MWSAPVTLPFLDLAVRPSVLMLVLCVLTCLWLGPRWVEPPEGAQRWRIRLFLMTLGVAVFAGGRAHFLLNHWSYLGSNTSWWKLLVGSIHAGGAITALALAGPLLLRAFRMPLGKLADGLIPTIGIGIAIARLGCFLQGCCFGTVCALPWCISVELARPACSAPAPTAPTSVKVGRWSASARVPHPRSATVRTTTATASSTRVAAATGSWTSARPVTTAIRATAIAAARPARPMPRALVATTATRAQVRTSVTGLEPAAAIARWARPAETPAWRT